MTRGHITLVASGLIALAGGVVGAWVFSPATPTTPLPVISPEDARRERIAGYLRALDQMPAVKTPRMVTEIDGCTIRAYFMPDPDSSRMPIYGGQRIEPYRYRLEPLVSPAVFRPDPEPQPEPAAAPSTPALQPVPDLDELLGLKPAGSSTAPAGPSAAQQDLEQRLKEGNIDDTFKQALALMDQARTRLSDQSDTGLDTQRVQEDILRKLDQVISQAKKQQQQSSSSSSSSSSSKQDQQSGQQPNQPQPQDAQSAAERAAQEQRAKDSNASAMPPPARAATCAPVSTPPAPLGATCPSACASRSCKAPVKSSRQHTNA